MNRQDYTIIATVLLMVGLHIFYVYTQNNLATEGDKLNTLQTQITQLQTENMLLKEQVLTAESYTTINKQARSAGFVDAKYLYLP